MIVIRSRNVIPEGTLFKSGGKWYYFDVGWKPLVPTVEFQKSLEDGTAFILMKADGEPVSPSAAKEEKMKRIFTPDEIKSGGMVWRTIRGNKVLIKPTGDGGGVVVGGASGKLNHFRVDLSTTKEQYTQQRKLKTEEDKAKTEERWAKMKPEEVAKEKTAIRQGMKIKKEKGAILKRDFEEHVATVIQNMESTDSKVIQTIKDEAKATVEDKIKSGGILGGGGGGSGGGGEGGGGGSFPQITPKEQKEIEKEAMVQAVQNHIKDLRHEAVEVLARTVTGEHMEIGEKFTAEQLDADTKAALSIYKADQKLKRELKKVSKEAKFEGAYLTKLAQRTKASTTAEISDMPDAEVEARIKAMAETQKNIDLYDKMDARGLATQRFVDQGAADSFNGLVAELFGAGAIFDADTIRNMGVESLSRAIAAKLDEDGTRSEALKALTRFFDENREKIVDEALGEFKDREKLKDSMKEIQKKLRTGEPADVVEWASAMSFYQRQNAAQIRNLGTAVGSLRAVAHLINALEEEPQKFINFPSAETTQEAHAKMRRMGLRASEGDYRVDIVGGKAVVTMPSYKITKMIDAAKSEALGNKKVNDIKAGRENNGYVPPGMATTFKKKDGTTSEMRLKAAQESCVRLYAERGSFIAQQEAGLGKTGIIYACAMEGLHNKGHKRQLIVVPANLREQMFKDGCDEEGNAKKGDPTWLTPEMRKLVKAYDPRLSPAERQARYAEEGIHIIGHEQLRTDADALEAAGFDAVFVDEAHRLTSPEGDAEAQSAATKQYEGLMRLQKVKHKVMLSGTNVKNSVDELYKKVNWIDPSHTLGSMEDFHKKYEGVNQGTGIFRSASVEAFRKEMSPYLFEQRNPLKIKHFEKEHKVNLSEKQMARFREINAIYTREKEAAKASGDPNAQSAASSRRDNMIYNALYDEGPDNPRAQALVDTIEKNHPGEPAIVHFRNKSALRSVKAALEAKYGKGCCGVIIGSTTATAEAGEDPLVKQKHEDVKKDFAAGKIRFILGTSALSTGHNGLQKTARVQFNYDLPQTYAEYGQRVARLARTGQDNDVTTYNMSSDHAMDVQARDIVMRKKAKHEMLGNPSEVGQYDESGFHTQLERAGFFAKKPKTPAVPEQMVAQGGA